MDKIKTIVATEKEEYYESIKRNSRYELVSGVILYKEGILEFLENQSEVQLILIDKDLPGEIDFKELQKSIKKINNSIQVDIIGVENNICLEFEKEEIEKSKDVKPIFQKHKILGIVGSNGIGKTTIARLIQDFNVGKNAIIICSETISSIEEEIEKQKSKYDLIIIDSLERIKNIPNFNFKLLDEILIISGANLVEIKKSIKLITIFNSVVKKKQVKLLFNKVSRYSIDDILLQRVFKEVKILGKIKYNDMFDEMANTDNYQKALKDVEIKEIIERI